ncbi:MAG TPA: BadF/BadG/BcrA/BcrD ATPase family protein [Longimicrobiales bacterium]|nr:BadF/BadG/BcrA/BcrD ATPase family protein [Longimicrobiales bacterium]
MIGLDGGGTRSTIAVADSSGEEVLRRVGPPGRIDPRDPDGSARRLIRLIHDTLAEAGRTVPADALCVGLAGAGTVSAREEMHGALRRAGVARAVEVLTDGEVALHGALGGGAGILLIAGTGSVAYGRSEDGRIARCGGWGEIAGDEGSGYAIALAGIRAALKAADGRGPGTGLLRDLLATVGLSEASAIPPWLGRAGKGEVAALGPRVISQAEAGDEVAGAILDRAARDLADHVAALVRRLGPWSTTVTVVFHGGALTESALADRVASRLPDHPPTVVRPAQADAVAGAIRRAIHLSESRRAVP